MLDSGRDLFSIEGGKGGMMLFGFEPVFYLRFELIIDLKKRRKCERFHISSGF